MVEVQPAYAETAYRVSLFGDEVESITHFDPLTGEVLGRLDDLMLYPATHYVTSPPSLERAVEEIAAETGGAGRAVRGAGQAARGAPPAPAHASTTSR